MKARTINRAAHWLGGVGGPSKRWTGSRPVRRAAQRRRGYRRMGYIGGAGAMMIGSRDSSPRSSGGRGYLQGHSSGGRM